ncbi:high affinity nitrate transporter 2.5-like isoform X2 [Magnolia sinica]|uniref:high affinity nitrate transporter 2.5-like isoform X2 n=1 Tax=Magnolia sinica TaxID=86752 RepID=UPI002658F825|nr:high affinity nitrate transporter 2.5-like isoform X2 [Magnolia sinica]
MARFAGMEETDKSYHGFSLPVNSDHKATELRLFSASPPHMRAFHLAWISLFTCFLSTFATAPLLPIIRDNLNLTDTDIGNAGIASVSGAIFSRLIMGPACDLIGPRLTLATVSLLIAPTVCFTSIASSATPFILLRFFAGLSIANFVANQFWMSSMFSASVVGFANGIGAGWANVGSGAALLLMPLIYSLICSIGVTSFTAWRVAFFVPATLQAVTAIMVLVYGQDLPDGNFRKLQDSGEKQRDDFFSVIFNGIKNYRGWILGLVYGYSFGVELTVDNIIAEYFYDRFGLGIRVAGMVAAGFGLANVVSRPSGGMVSDAMGRRFGMRGRLWSLWVVQAIAGALCVLLGRVNSLGGSAAVMFAFSLFVQAASGLTFGIVPFVSKRSLGVISGMTGSGGTVGAAVTQYLFFSGSNFSKETGITLMGILILTSTLPITFIHFPQWGGMFCGPSVEANATEEDYYLLEWDTKETDTSSPQA